MQPEYDSSLIGPAQSSVFRTSDQIREDVINLINENDVIQPKDIEVIVNDGVIILKGKVRDELAKQEAEQAASEVLGVVKIENQLEVGI
ncbi:MAG: BON domain-containing protein [Armatimonadetes bacterium]|nr:BON domain-containing protein [Armatimonadota bacterium]